MIFGKHINRYYLRYCPLLLLGLFALVVVDVLQLEIPELYGAVVSGMNTGMVEWNGESIPFDMDFLLDHICRPIIGIILAMVTGRFLWRVCFLGAAVRMETHLRNRMFNHCKDLSHQYYQVNKVGNLMSLFTNDLDTIQECFGWGILTFFDAAFLGGLSVIKMWQMDPFLTGLSMIPMAFLLAVALLLGSTLTKRWDARQAAFSELSDFSQESFSGIAVIKAFVKETLELCAFKQLNRKNEETNIAYTRTSVLMRIFVTLFVESVVCVILGYGGYLVWLGDGFDAGHLVEFIGYFTAVVWPVMAITELIDMTSRGRASLKRVSELLDATPDVVDGPNAAPVAPLTGKIEFRDLSFRYPDGDQDALSHINFTIEAGERVGLVGKTGSGKTTIVDLILRTYNIPDASIYLDGHDINDIPIRQVRASCAYVPQDNFLFSDTIANNISFGTDDRTQEGIEEAARLSDVHENITEFQDRYETVLGERGVTVSGGQKQRISIARALMKNAPILILDDSVSAVDTGTEKTILENLRRTREGRTTILIAHRISTIEGMDKIIFIDEGTTVDVGTHAELYARCADYRRMVDLQKLEQEGGEAVNA